MQRLVRGVVLLAIMIAVLAATTILIVLSVRTDVISDMVEADNQIPVLITIEHENEFLVTQALFYQPGTNRGALFDIPSHTGVVVRALNRIDAIDSVYRSDGVDQFRDQVGTLLGSPVQFHLAMDLNGFSALVDAVEGLPLFVTEVSDDDPGATTIPSGDVVLDGAKAVQYLSYRAEGERERERIARHQKTILALFDRLGEFHDDLVHPSAARILSDSLETNIEQAALASFFNELESFESGRIITRQVEGVSRNVEIEDDVVTLLFPHQEGRWLRESVRQVVSNLSSEESIRDENIVIRLEILNGTSVVGLAARTAERYRSFGFDVVSVGNAERDDTEATVIIDRTGNPLFASRTADIIRAPEVELETNPQSPVDVTIVLGRDFDGRYVRQR